VDLFIPGVAAVGIIWQGLKLAKEKHHLTACQWVALGFLILAGIGQVYCIPYIEPVDSKRFVLLKCDVHRF